jgi:predicted PurR-regulated permease PerM
MGIPTAVSAIALWLLVVILFYGMIMLLSAPVVGWIAKAPDIGRSLMEKVRVLERPFAALDDLRKAISPGGQGGGGGLQLDLLALIQPAVGLVTPALAQMLIFFATLFFYLLGHTQVRHGIVGAFEGREARLMTLRILNDTERNLTRYLTVVAVINFGVGIGAGIIAFAVGLPSPLAWAGLAFIMNFIPYLGAVLMELSLFAVGLVTFDTVTHALIAPLLYIAMAIVEGQFVTPHIIGHRLLLNPMIVFLSLVFWTWLWGPFGAFLAVPILIIMMVVFNHLFPSEEPTLPG